MAYINTSRALLIMHKHYPDEIMLKKFADLIPNFEAGYFRAIARGLQDQGYLAYSPALKVRRLTDKGEGAIAAIENALFTAWIPIADLHLWDITKPETIVELLRLIAPACRIEHDQWVQERAQSTRAE